MTAPFAFPTPTEIRQSIAAATGRPVAEDLSVRFVHAQVRQPNERLLSILLSVRPISDDDAAFVAACERGE